MKVGYEHTQAGLLHMLSSSGALPASAPVSLLVSPQPICVLLVILCIYFIVDIYPIKFSDHNVLNLIECIISLCSELLLLDN